MSEAIRNFKADVKRDMTEDRASQFFIILLALVIVAAFLFTLRGNGFAAQVLAFMAGGIPAGLLVVLMTYHPRLRKPAIVIAVAAMPLWIILGVASLAPGLWWLEPAFGGVSSAGFTLAAAVQGAVMLCMIMGLLAIFGKYQRR